MRKSTPVIVQVSRDRTRKLYIGRGSDSSQIVFTTKHCNALVFESEQDEKIEQFDSLFEDVLPGVTTLIPVRR
jgi:hypothetical protein